MTQSARQPSLDGEIAGMKRRISDLERQLRQGIPTNRPDTVFSLGGPLYLSSSSPYPVPSARRYKRLTMALTVAGSTTTSIELTSNGDTIGTFTIGGTITVQTHRLSVGAEPGDLLIVELTAVGTGAEGLTVALWT